MTASLKITKLLDDTGALTAKDIAKRTGVRLYTVNGVLQELKKRGFIQSTKVVGKPVTYATTAKEYTGEVTRFRRPVVCTAPDGTVTEYPSVHACAEVLAIRYGNLWKSITNGWRVHGYKVDFK